MTDSHLIIPLAVSDHVLYELADLWQYTVSLKDKYWTEFAYNQSQKYESDS